VYARIGGVALAKTLMFVMGLDLPDSSFRYFQGIGVEYCMI